MSVSRLGMNALRSSSWISYRSLSASSVALQQKASDPVQQLFVDKVREYAQKKKSSSGGLVEASPAVEAELKAELDKIAKAFGGGAGVDMTKFPAFNFADPKVEVPSLD